MALWQYQFNLIPKCANGPAYLEKDADGMFDDSEFWIKTKIPCSTFDPIGKILPRSQSWSKNIILYGSTESNCFEALCKNGIAVSVSFRINFTTKYHEILKSLVDFCIAHNMIIMDEDLKKINLDFNSVNQIIINAPQVRRYNELTSN